LPAVSGSWASSGIGIPTCPATSTRSSVRSRAPPMPGRSNAPERPPPVMTDPGPPPAPAAASRRRRRRPLGFLAVCLLVLLLVAGWLYVFAPVLAPPGVTLGRPARGRGPADPVQRRPRPAPPDRDLLAHLTGLSTRRQVGAVPDPEGPSSGAPAGLCHLGQQAGRGRPQPLGRRRADRPSGGPPVGRQGCLGGLVGRQRAGLPGQRLGQLPAVRSQATWTSHPTPLRSSGAPVLDRIEQLSQALNALLTPPRRAG
jgi:hypothetical protein